MRLTLADPSPDSFGSKLRDAREQRGTSLREIAESTKISMSALEALERNDISRLPGGIFTRAFVRSYAVEVGLDPEQTIREFLAYYPHASVSAGHPESAAPEADEPQDSGRRAAATFIKLAAIGLPVVLALIYLSTGRGAAPVQTVGAPVAASTTVPSAVRQPPTDSPSAVSSAAATAAGTAAPVESARPSAVDQEAPAAGATDASPAGLVVALTVRERCWVSVLVDGERAIQRELEPGEQQTFDVHREIVMTAGNAGAVDLTLNGSPARPLGQAGEVVTRRFNLMNFKSYLAAP